jgi:NAD(P)-dependent dehydrogenase (short-subunit alcohol dehydrogenase family)
MEGVFLGTKNAIAAMKRSGGGSIINISSIAGLVGTPNAPSYNASKGAVRLFTKAVAVACSKAGHNYNIRVNSVYPGYIKSSMTGNIFKDKARKKQIEELHPMGHLGEAEDIAYGVLYLASDESKFVTGSELVIDGGYTMV